MMEIKEIEFSKLRLAYIVVKSFLETESLEKIDSLNMKIAEDLKFFGDDNLYLLENFVTKFELEHNNFDYDKHFHSEGELFDSSAAFINLLTLSIWLPLRTIELLTFNKIKLDKPKFWEPKRKVLDLTFKDLITWYLEKDYKTSDNLLYKLKTE